MMMALTRCEKLLGSTGSSTRLQVHRDVNHNNSYALLRVKNDLYGGTQSHQLETRSTYPNVTLKCS